VDVPPVRPQPTPEPVVGWIGSPSTGRFVEQVLPALAELAQPPAVTLVGAQVSSPPGLRVDARPWSSAIEMETLASVRVGLYPIDPSHPLADGKCGLKAILYMSCGVPPIVTPTATNAGIVRHEVEGLHARDLSEWGTAVRRLLDDPELWDRCSRAAHARARTDFSLEQWGPRVARRLAQLVEASS
jgi:glycosyltransferase involved in cell wall biosynthesis